MSERLQFDHGGRASRAERAIHGRELRQVVPRRTLRDWAPASDRPDPISILEAQATSRVPELVPIRYGRMAAGPFSFYRGAAAVMAADLASVATTGIDVQLCGDAHLVNFGLFATAERNLVFDLNDFDETLPGSWEWDLLRLAASFEVAGRSNGYGGAETAAAVEAAVRSYRDRLAEYADMHTMDVFYARVDVDAVRENLAATGRATAKRERTVATAEARARRHDTVQALAKLTQVTDGRRVFVDQPPLIDHIASEDAERHILEVYQAFQENLAPELRKLLERFTLVDVARKVVGVGSVGTRCWIALLEGGGDDDALILQVKEAQASVLEPYLGAAAQTNHGERVVFGQRYTQAAGDLFLGWCRDERTGVDYYWRQLRDMKGSAAVETMSASRFAEYAGLCGWALARAHARTGDAAMLVGYIGKGDELARSVRAFASTYADQNERDHEALVAAIRSGRVVAEDGV